MSDGNHATPGTAPRSARASRFDDHDVGHTGMAPQSRGAAPWERFGAPARGPVVGTVAYRPRPPSGSAPPAERAVDENGETGGCHTDGGLSVADLIAKLGGPATTQPIHHHAAPDLPPYDEQPNLPEYEPDDRYDAYADPATSAYVAELPDISELSGLEEFSHPPRRPGDYADAEETTLLPKLPSSAPMQRETTRRTWAMRPGPAPMRLAEVGVPPAHREEPADTSDGTLATRIIEAPVDDETPSPKPRHQHRLLLAAGRSVAASVAALALMLTGGAWQWSTSKNHRLNTISALDPHSRDIVNPNGQYGDEDFLIVGTDSRAGENSHMGAGDTEDAGGVRSDTIMLVNIPANRKRVVVVSFPRDLATTPIQCEPWNPETGAYGPLYDADTKKYGPKSVYTETKLNSTFAFGGPKCLVKEIQKLSGLSINRFIAIDFAGFAKMVDAIGGVEVCSATALKDDELGTVLAHGGRQVVDSKTALNYVRARKVTTEYNGDYGRIKRQQLFLSSLLRSLISKDTFFSLSKLNKVVNTFIGDSYVDNVKTKDLVELGQSVQGMSAGHVTFVTVPTGETDENGDEPPRAADMRALFDAIINDDPLPGENDLNVTSSPSTKPTTTANAKAPQASPSTAAHPEHVQAVTTAPQDITVQVSNSTGKSGLASTASNALKRHGFKVMTPDDYPSKLKSTTVFFSPGNEQAAATVAASFANSKIERVTGIGQVVQVVLGPDFSSVNAPPATGSSISVQLDRNASSPPTKLPEDLTVTNAADTTCA
jgi:LCP family protein required for cell wall assembly